MGSNWGNSELQREKCDLGLCGFFFQLLLTMISPPLNVTPSFQFIHFSPRFSSLLILYFLIQPFLDFFLLIFSLLIKFPASLLYISTTYFSFAHVRSLCVSFKHSFTKFFLHWGFSSLVLMYYFWLISSLKPLLSFFFHFSHSHAGENKFTFS